MLDYDKKEIMKRLVEHLTPREIDVFVMRVFYEMTLEKIGQEIEPKVSKERVRCIYMQSIHKIRKKIDILNREIKNA